MFIGIDPLIDGVKETRIRLDHHHIPTSYITQALDLPSFYKTHSNIIVVTMDDLNQMSLRQLHTNSKVGR